MAMHDLNCNHSKPHFTRMHHQLVADALGPFYDRYPVAASLAGDYLSAMFSKDNHLFDDSRFKSAIYGNKKGYR